MNSFSRACLHEHMYVCQKKPDGHVMYPGTPAVQCSIEAVLAGMCCSITFPTFVFCSILLFLLLLFLLFSGQSLQCCCCCFCRRWGTQRFLSTTPIQQRVHSQTQAPLEFFFRFLFGTNSRGSNRLRLLRQGRLRFWGCFCSWLLCIGLRHLRYLRLCSCCRCCFSFSWLVLSAIGLFRHVCRDWFLKSKFLCRHGFCLGTSWWWYGRWTIRSWTGCALQLGRCCAWSTSDFVLRCQVFSPEKLSCLQVLSFHQILGVFIRIQSHRWWRTSCPKDNPLRSESHAWSVHDMTHYEYILNTGFWPRMWYVQFPCGAMLKFQYGKGP